MRGGVLGRQLLVRARADELHAVADPEAAIWRSSASRSAPSPTIRRRNGASELRGGVEQHGKPFFATSRPTASRSQRTSAGGGGRGAEALEVDAVRHELHRRAGAAQVAGDVGVARDHARGAAWPGRRARAAHLARVDGVDAEAVRDARGGAAACAATSAGAWAK